MLKIHQRGTGLVHAGLLWAPGAGLQPELRSSAPLLLRDGETWEPPLVTPLGLLAQEPPGLKP